MSFVWSKALPKNEVAEHRVNELTLRRARLEPYLITIRGFELKTITWAELALREAIENNFDLTASVVVTLLAFSGLTAVAPSWPGLAKVLLAWDAGGTMLVGLTLHILLARAPVPAKCQPSNRSTRKLDLIAIVAAGATVAAVGAIWDAVKAAHSPWFKLHIGIAVATTAIVGLLAAGRIIRRYPTRLPKTASA